MLSSEKILHKQVLGLKREKLTIRTCSNSKQNYRDFIEGEGEKERREEGRSGKERKPIHPEKPQESDFL